jgi:hypothetical protein
MPNVIIFTTDAGNVGVCTPTGEIPIEQVQIKDIPAGKESFIVDFATLPTQYDHFFDAWEQTGGVVTVSLEKSKTIMKEWLRLKREPLLQAQDVAFQRALENGDSTASIVAEKQRLRDITKLVDVCDNLDDLALIRC